MSVQKQVYAHFSHHLHPVNPHLPRLHPHLLRSMVTLHLRRSVFGIRAKFAIHLRMLVNLKPGLTEPITSAMVVSCLAFLDAPGWMKRLSF
jgi:hypothetical protein